MPRSKSSQSWLKAHHEDQYVLQARRDGYRSRAVYKLLELQRKDRILKPGQRVVDLGAAPGGWCEYVSRFNDDKVNGDKGCIIAIDLLPVEPIAGVDFIQGDFTGQETLNLLLSRVESQALDLVLSDMAPNLSGVESVDQPKSVYLVELAFELASDCLDTDGIFVTKLFQGKGFDALVSAFRQRFKSVKLRKPDASRPGSREIYAVCRGLK